MIAEDADVELAVSAGGLLAEFNAAGVLNLADVNTAHRLSRMLRETDERVALALALAVRAVRGGSVCIDLAALADTVFESESARELSWPEPDGWLAAVAASPMTAAAHDVEPAQPGRARPLRLLGSLLYLDRYWRQEEAVRIELTRRRGQSLQVHDGFLRRALDLAFSREGLGEHEANWQRIAAAVAVLSPITVLAGGPGTGKTTTVAALLALLNAQPGHPPRIALAAPTGKAAARLEEAVREAARELPPALDFGADELSASTIHRLLGWRAGSRSRFRHHRGNPLPYDVVVVDEMSMVSLTMMDRLIEAVPAGARLILVGDPDQLTSVEAGAVMADITRAEALTGRADPAAAEAGIGRLLAITADDRAEPRPDELAGAAAGVVELTHTWRFGGGIAELADAIRAGDSTAALASLHRFDDLRLIEADPARLGLAELPGVPASVLTAGRALDEAARAGDAPAALAAMERNRVLCGHRRGPYGVARWGREVEELLRAEIAEYGTGGEWYLGRPLLITENDPGVGLYNGDTGVMVRSPEGPRAAFVRRGRPDLLAPVQLASVQTVHAMTVHKAQGSQFQAVTLVLPPAGSPLLTRELVYTAVTRARSRVDIIGSPQALTEAIGRPANRASGLRNRL